MSQISYMCKNENAINYSHDLLEEILKRLPIKSLYRFRSVCKLWNSIISSSLFINLHFSFTCSSIPRHLKPYLHVSFRRYHDDRELNNLIHNGYALFRPLNDVEHLKQQVYFPFRADRENGIKIYNFIDSIHGLICFTYTWFASHQWPSLSHVYHAIILWNPSIRKYIALPSIELSIGIITIGFGYDATRNDFKLVLIWRTTYHVYSVRQGLWTTRTAKDGGFNFKCLHAIGCFDQPIFVNGTIHWMLQFRMKTIHGYRTVKYSLLMFDCESEEFTRSEIPPKLYSSCESLGKGVIELLEYAGMLAALVKMRRIWDRGYHADLWVMEEHGVSSSWKKLYMLTNNNDIGIIRCDSSFEKMSPFGPNNPWNKYQGSTSNIYQSRDRVYDETMILMDCPKARSYTDQEIVPILVDDDSI